MKEVICIDNQNTERNPYWDDIVNGYPLNAPTLTVGKKYTITRDYGNKVKVIADWGEERLYKSSLFVDIQKWRDKQLNDLINESNSYNKSK